MKKNEAIEFFGSQVKLADALGINKSAISQWGDYVPELRAFQIEKITNGELKVNSQEDAA